jgi:hypothetical protein
LNRLITNACRLDLKHYILSGKPTLFYLFQGFDGLEVS